MIEPDKITFTSFPEMFFVEGNLVAVQPAYNTPFHKDRFHETKHFYCGICGKEWGLRIAPDFPETLHHFYKARCKEHSGKNDMLSPFEWDHLDLLSGEVLAYTLLQQVPKEGNDEIS